MYRIILLFCFFAFVISSSIAHADELFIPSNMLISGNYQGVFIRDDPKLAQIITLVSNSDIIDIPNSIYLAPDQNHALFEIVLRGIGDSKIIAHDGKNYFNSTTSIISDQKKDYNIFLVLPEKTSTSDVMGTVFLIDDFFNPVYPDEDVFVSFATENIDVPKQLKISAGNSYASFPANIKGDSWITAYTDKSTSDTLRINFNMAKKEVHIGIAAADALLPYSFTYLFVWLTENGIPLEPTLPIKTTLHVSDVNIIGIDGFSRDTSETVYLRNGFFMKKLTTNNVGEASVTVSVPGYGTASKTVTVGTISDIEESIIEQHLLEGCDVDLIGAGYNGCDTEDFHPTSREQFLQNLIQMGSVGTDIIVAETFPSITSVDAYLVWSLYTEVNSELFPTYGEKGTDFFITSQNLSHDGIVSFETDQRKTQTNIIPISGNIIGNHTVSISSIATSSVSTTELEIVSPVKYNLSIVSLPPLGLNENRPLFAVSVLDSDGYVVDPHFMFGDLSVTLFSDDVKFTQKTIFLDEAVNIIHGISSVSYPSVTILANDHDILISKSYKPTSALLVDIQMPKKVHSNEEFPAYGFLTSDDGTPISSIQNYLQTKCKNTENGLFSCENDSEFMIFEKAIGFATKTLSVFENKFGSGDISFDLDDDNPIGVGSTFVIRYTIPPDATLHVETTIPYVLNDDSIVFTPDFIGKHDVYFSVIKPGYETHLVNTSYFVNDGIDLTLRTVISGGVAIPSSVSLSYGDESISVSTPGNAEIPRGDMHFEFESSIIIDSAGYSFDSVMISEIVYDSPIIDISLMLPTDITATYVRVINIVTNNAMGGGVYDYGEYVTISAPPHDIVGFLIRDVFDYWSYLPSGYDVRYETVTILADESFATSAVYRPDYSGIILSVVFIALLIFGFLNRDRLFSIVKTYLPIKK